MKKLTIIIPVFNEQATIDQIISRLEAADYHGVSTELLIVDDGSTDTTRDLLQKHESNHQVFYQPTNQGKGAAIHRALAGATGDYVIIQDADLEYDPQDIQNLVTCVEQNNARIVYGSRLLETTQRGHWTYYLAGRMISIFTNILYGTHITDEPTGYKLIETDLMRSLNLSANGFGFCAEMTAKIARQKIPIYEVAISYKPRSKKDGKKIKFKDALITFWLLFKYRFSK